MHRFQSAEKVYTSATRALHDEPAALGATEIHLNVTLPNMALPASITAAASSNGTAQQLPPTGLQLELLKARHVFELTRGSLVQAGVLPSEQAADA